MTDEREGVAARQPIDDPLLQGALELLEDSLAGIRTAIEGAPAEMLNRRPLGEDTNTIAVLATHALHSTRWWLSVAMDAPAPDRDRPSEFDATSRNAGELIALLDLFGRECRALIEGGVPFDPGARRESRPAYGPPETVTAAWALLHALEHLREHVAHLQLTRQFLQAAAPA
jgi:DinB superfamily